MLSLLHLSTCKSSYVTRDCLLSECIIVGNFIYIFPRQYQYRVEVVWIWFPYAWNICFYCIHDIYIFHSYNNIFHFLILEIVHAKNKINERIIFRLLCKPDLTHLGPVAVLTELPLAGQDAVFESKYSWRWSKKGKLVILP